MAGNVVVGGLIGAAVDAGSGAMKDLKPNPIQVNLELLDSTQESTIEKNTKTPEIVKKPEIVELPEEPKDPEPTKNLKVRDDGRTRF